jgi:hypothetical protein
MSGWRGRGPRARAASTSRANAAARSGGTARSHSAVICLTLTFASARCSRSCLDRFVIWSSSRKRGIGADWDTYFALIWGACLGLTSKACSAPSGRRASLRWDAGPTCGYGSRPRTVWASACMAAAVGDGVFNGTCSRIDRENRRGRCRSWRQGRGRDASSASCDCSSNSTKPPRKPKAAVRIPTRWPDAVNHRPPQARVVKRPSFRVGQVVGNP